MMNPFSTGQWIRWITPDKVKEGQVLAVEGPSIVVRWLGGDDQVFPVVEGYFPPFGGSQWRLEVIPRPARASTIERDAARGHMSVARAAALLGSTPKRVRAMLRSGALKGLQIDGKWTAVEAGDVMARVEHHA